MSRLSKRFKWAVVTPTGRTLLTKKPRKVAGGYMDEFGGRYIGKGVQLYERQFLPPIVVLGSDINSEVWKLYKPA